MNLTRQFFKNTCEVDILVYMSPGLSFTSRSIVLLAFLVHIRVNKDFENTLKTHILQQLLEVHKKSWKKTLKVDFFGRTIREVIKRCVNMKEELDSVVRYSGSFLFCPRYRD